MNTCPNCGKNLKVIVDRKNYDLERKRWYEYAGHKIYCKYCNCRLKYTYPSYMRLFLEPHYKIVISLIIFGGAETIFKKHGMVGVIIYWVIGYLLSRKVKYERWEDPESTKP